MRFTRGLLDLRATPNPAQPEWLMNLDTFKAMYLSDNDGYDFPHVVRLAEIMPGSDVFIGVSGPNLINRDDVLTMAKDPIVFAMAQATASDVQMPRARILGVGSSMATNLFVLQP